jgi:hypothetical protein
MNLVFSHKQFELLYSSGFEVDFSFRLFSEHFFENFSNFLNQHVRLAFAEQQTGGVMVIRTISEHKTLLCPITMPRKHIGDVNAKV